MFGIFAVKCPCYAPKVQSAALETQYLKFGQLLGGEKGYDRTRYANWSVFKLSSFRIIACREHAPWTLGRRAKNEYLWLRKRLHGGQSLVSPLLLLPPAPPCAGRLNHGPKHCHVLSCTRHKLRSRSSVRGGGGGALGTAGARSMGSSAWGRPYERPDGAVGSAESPHAPRMVR